MNPPNCPKCGEPLNTVITKVIAQWYFDDDLGHYEEEDPYTQTRTQYCPNPNCKHDLEHHLGRIEAFDMEVHNADMST